MWARWAQAPPRLGLVSSGHLPMVGMIVTVAGHWAQCSLPVSAWDPHHKPIGQTAKVETGERPSKTAVLGATCLRMDKLTSGPRTGTKAY